MTVLRNQFDPNEIPRDLREFFVEVEVQCGAPWRRCVTTSYENPGNRTTNGPRSIDNAATTTSFGVRLERRSETTGWEPTCACGAGEPVPQTVLDPFSGSATTGVVALRHGRNYVGIDLNPAYVELGRKRIVDDCPMFNNVEVIESRTPIDQSVPALDKDVLMKEDDGLLWMGVRILGGWAH